MPRLTVEDVKNTIIEKSQSYSPQENKEGLAVKFACDLHDIGLACGQQLTAAAVNELIKQWTRENINSDAMVKKYGAGLDYFLRETVSSLDISALLRTRPDATVSEIKAQRAADIGSQHR